MWVIKQILENSGLISQGMPFSISLFYRKYFQIISSVEINETINLIKRTHVAYFNRFLCHKSLYYSALWTFQFQRFKWAFIFIFMMSHVEFIFLSFMNLIDFEIFDHKLFFMWHIFNEPKPIENSFKKFIIFYLS